jgi:hypothetical protein
VYGFGIATGAATGYGSGETYGGTPIRPGLGGALMGAAKGALPINLVGQIVEEVRAPDGTTSTGGIVGRIALATVQDIGNVGGMGDLIETVGTLGKAGGGLTSAAERAAEAGGDVAGSGKGVPWRQPGEPLRPMDPQMPRNPTPADRAFFEGREQGQKLAEDFSDLVQKARQAEKAGDPAALAQANKNVQDAAIEIASNYNAKLVLKNSPPSLQGKYADAMEPVFQQATKEMVDNLNASGMKIGGRDVHVDDFVDLRNAASKGSVPMDRDLALNQMRARDLADKLERMPANPPKGSLDELNKSIMQNHLDLLHSQSQISVGGQAISPGNANPAMQQAYNNAYQNITGQLTGTPRTAESAMQSVTHAGHGEAYHDLNAIKNNLDKAPLNSVWAEQTGSVTSFKAAENVNPHSSAYQGLGNTDDLRKANAVLETSRGVVKDINTKVLPAMEAAGASPQAIDRMTDIKGFLNGVAKGQHPPSVADAMAQTKFGTSVNGLAEQASSNLSAAVSHGPVRLPPPAVPPTLTPVQSNVITGAGLAGGQVQATQPTWGDQNDG